MTRALRLRRLVDGFGITTYPSKNRVSIRKPKTILLRWEFSHPDPKGRVHRELGFPCIHMYIIYTITPIYIYSDKVTPLRNNRVYPHRHKKPDSNVLYNIIFVSSRVVSSLAPNNLLSNDENYTPCIIHRIPLSIHS